MLNHIWRTVLPVVALMSILAVPGRAQDTPQPPNVLLILADDVGREVLECYGGTSYKTPHLNRLAEDGLKFQHFYAMPSCHPTRVCLLTGRYPFHIGSPKWGTFPAAVEKQTVAHAMKSAGYATAISGKWQIATLGEELDHPQRLGFDQYALFGWHEGPRYYDPLIWKNGARWEGIADRYGPDLYVEFLVDFMKQNRERPFFAYYSMALCHDVTDDLDEPVPYGPHGRYDTFAEMAAAMDERIGTLLQSVDDLGLRDNTVVIFTTDNGTPARSIDRFEDGKYIRNPVASEFGGKMVPGGKTKLNDWGTRVPTIVRWPGVVEPSRETNALADLADLLPTIAAIGGAEVPAEWKVDGRSFVDVLQGKNTAGREWVFAQVSGANVAAGQKAWVRSQRWKLYGDGRLFDMQTDPEEEKPVPTENESPQAAGARKSLSAVWDTLKASASP